MATPIRTISGAHGDPLAEAIELAKRLKLPHLRRALSDLIPTAKANSGTPPRSSASSSPRKPPDVMPRTCGPDASEPGSPQARRSATGTRPSPP